MKGLGAPQVSELERIVQKKEILYTSKNVQLKNNQKLCLKTLIPTPNELQVSRPPASVGMGPEAV